MAKAILLAWVALLCLGVTSTQAQYCPTCPPQTGGYSVPFSAPPPSFYGGGCNGGSYGYSNGYSNGYSGYGYAPMYQPPPRVLESYAPSYQYAPREPFFFRERPRFELDVRFGGGFRGRPLFFRR